MGLTWTDEHRKEIINAQPMFLKTNCSFRLTFEEDFDPSVDFFTRAQESATLRYKDFLDIAVLNVTAFNRSWQIFNVPMTYEHTHYSPYSDNPSKVNPV